MTQGEFKEMFRSEPALIGMVHLMPLPGAPGYAGSMAAVVERAVAEAGSLADAGFNGVLIENFNDAPFFPGQVPPETVAAMAVAVREVHRTVSIPIGVNVLRNDGEAALAVAVAAGASFIRVNVLTGAMITDQGLIQGRAHTLLRLRRSLGACVWIFADLLVKHAQPLVRVMPGQAAEETVERGLADALIVTGAGTGKPADLAEARAVRTAVPETPLLLGSGVRTETVKDWLEAVDGIIIGSDLKHGGVAGAPLDAARAAAFVRAVRAPAW